MLLSGRVEAIQRGVVDEERVGVGLVRVAEYDDFDPRRDYPVTVTDGELTESERNAAAGSADDIELDLP